MTNFAAPAGVLSTYRGGVGRAASATDGREAVCSCITQLVVCRRKPCAPSLFGRRSYRIPGSWHLRMVYTPTATSIDIIANNPIDQKVVELSSSQHYSLGENSIYRSVFLPQGVEAGVFLPSSP